MFLKEVVEVYMYCITLYNLLLKTDTIGITCHNISLLLPYELQINMQNTKLMLQIN